MVIIYAKRRLLTSVLSLASTIIVRSFENESITSKIRRHFAAKVFPRMNIKESNT